jgi:mycothiol system anti-sigma-R factor
MRDRAECEAVVRQMWGYLDGAIPAAQTEMVSKHVATCVDCAAHFDFAAEFLHAVARSSSRQPATDALRTRVLAALTAETSIAD